MQGAKMVHSTTGWESLIYCSNDSWLNVDMGIFTCLKILKFRGSYEGTKYEKTKPKGKVPDNRRNFACKILNIHLQNSLSRSLFIGFHQS